MAKKSLLFLIKSDFVDGLKTARKEPFIFLTNNYFDGELSFLREFVRIEGSSFYQFFQPIDETFCYIKEAYKNLTRVRS